MNRSAMFSCLLNMDGYGQADSNFTGAVITDALDEFGKSGETDMYDFAVKYAKKVMLAIPDMVLRTHDSDNKFNLSDSTRKWEYWGKGLVLAATGREVMKNANAARADKVLVKV
jgi:hypothetical protein